MQRIEADLLIPGRGKPIRDGCVILDGDRITFGGAIEDAPRASGVETIRVSAVMPGMWESHGHFLGLRTGTIEEVARTPVQVAASRATKDADRTLQAGFTSVREVGSHGVYLARAVDEGPIAGPHIYGAGATPSVTGGHGDRRPDEGADRVTEGRNPFPCADHRCSEVRMAGGEVIVETFDSKVLRGNPLKDPTRRDVAIYLPPRYDPNRRYPAAYAIVGYTGTGKSLLGVDPLGEDVKSKLDRLIRTGKMGPMIVPMVDCFTRVGGNQYINSSATGRYDDYLRKEIVPHVESKYRVGGRGIWGKSSGGYGSIVQGMLHPDTWSALADHSGDALFEFCYTIDFPKALAAFRDHGGPTKWLRWFWRQPNRRRNDFGPVLNTIGMAAHYSPNPRSKELGTDFPFDLETGEWRPDVWARWRAWDPVNMVDRYAANLRRLRLVYIDCGTQDQFNLIWGARVLHRKLLARKIKHVFEEFDDTHSNISYRYDISLPRLWRSLKP